MDSAIDEVRAEMGRVVAQKHNVTKAIGKLNQEHGQISVQLEIAMGEDRKDLLELAVSRQIDIEDQLPALETQLGECSSQISEFEQAVTGLVAKRNEMEDELFDFQEQKAKAALASGNDAAAAINSASGESAVHKARRLNAAACATGLYGRAPFLVADLSGGGFGLARTGTNEPSGPYQARLKEHEGPGPRTPSPADQSHPCTSFYSIWQPVVFECLHVVILIAVLGVLSTLLELRSLAY